MRWTHPFDLLLCAVAATVIFVGARASHAEETTPVPTITDVTPRAFSIVWAADEPITSATIEIFADPEGTQDITDSVTIATTSASVAEAHPLGLARVDARGLTPDTCYYARTLTTTVGGTAHHPAAPPYLEACTQLEARTTDAALGPINNDLIVHEVARRTDAPGGEGSSAAGTLVLLEAPGLSRHPLSTFVTAGEEGPPLALVDLNNLFDSEGDRINSRVQPGEPLRISEHRGLACGDPELRTLVRFRRAPAHDEITTSGKTLTEPERPTPCFFADPFCDDVVDLADAQWVLNTFGHEVGQCGFHPDLDLVDDGVINILDVQSVLNRFGETAPFEPRGEGP